jgi:hypothetical protein
MVAQARPLEFVGTKRLEEVWPGYGWCSALSPGFFRCPFEASPRKLQSASKHLSVEAISEGSFIG